MSALRQHVYALVAASPELAALGYGPEGVYPNYSPDSPPQTRFLVLRWGQTARGIGGANQISLNVWLYNREPDFGPITDAIMVLREMLPDMIGNVLPGGKGSVLGVDWQGDTDDAYDDAYRAWVRQSQHTLTASGI